LTTPTTPTTTSSKRRTSARLTGKQPRRCGSDTAKLCEEAGQRIRELTQQCEKLREERNAVRVKYEQPLLLRVGKLEAAMRAAAERSPLNMADAMRFSELLGND